MKIQKQPLIVMGTGVLVVRVVGAVGGDMGAGLDDLIDGKSLAETIPV